MPLLSQKNVSYFFAFTVGWSTALPLGLLPDKAWVHDITDLCVIATAVLGYLGYYRTPAGNQISPAIASVVDRQAIIEKAKDIVLNAAAKKVEIEAKESLKEEKPNDKII